MRSQIFGVWVGVWAGGLLWVWVCGGCVCVCMYVCEGGGGVIPSVDKNDCCWDIVGLAERQHLQCEWLLETWQACVEAVDSLVLLNVRVCACGGGGGHEWYVCVCVCVCVSPQLTRRQMWPCKSSQAEAGKLESD
jgi:hypothetical protein